MCQLCRDAAAGSALDFMLVGVSFLAGLCPLFRSSRVYSVNITCAPMSYCTRDACCHCVSVLRVCASSPGARTIALWKNKDTLSIPRSPLPGVPGVAPMAMTYGIKKDTYLVIPKGLHRSTCSVGGLQQHNNLTTLAPHLVWVCRRKV